MIRQITAAGREFVRLGDKFRMPLLAIGVRMSARYLYYRPYARRSWRAHFNVRRLARTVLILCDAISQIP